MGPHPEEVVRNFSETWSGLPHLGSLCFVPSTISFVRIMCCLLIFVFQKESFRSARGESELVRALCFKYCRH
jgi:hypothetical protein